MSSDVDFDAILPQYVHTQYHELLLVTKMRIMYRLYDTY